MFCTEYGTSIDPRNVNRSFRSLLPKAGVGIASGLWQAIAERLTARGVSHVDAWTRDDVGTLAWYRTNGFREQTRYLHVYASTTAEAAAAFGNRADLMPRTGFFHAWTEHEARLREEFRRVHICRRFATSL